MSKTDTSIGSKLSKSGTGKKKKKVKKAACQKTLKFNINLTKGPVMQTLFEPSFTIDEESMSPDKEPSDKSKGLRMRNKLQLDDSVFED